MEKRSRVVANAGLGPVIVCIIGLTLVGAAREAVADAHTAAKQNYDLFCAQCHGATGKGDGPAGASLSTKPRDFTECERMAKFSDDELFTAIKEGGEAVGLSKDMPPWKAGLSDDDIRALVAFVRSFCPDQAKN